MALTIKLTIKIAVFRCDLTLVAKYAFLQALSHFEIRGILQPGPLALYSCRPTIWDHVGLDRGDHGRLEDQRQLGGSKDLMAEEAEGTRQLGSQTKFKRQQEYETLNSS